jgi:hypothetical protein
VRSPWRFSNRGETSADIAQADDLHYVSCRAPWQLVALESRAYMDLRESAQFLQAPEQQAEGGCPLPAGCFICAAATPRRRSSSSIRPCTPAGSTRSRAFSHRPAQDAHSQLQLPGPDSVIACSASRSTMRESRTGSSGSSLARTWTGSLCPRTANAGRPEPPEIRPRNSGEKIEHIRDL